VSRLSQTQGNKQTNLVKTTCFIKLPFFDHKTGKRGLASKPYKILLARHLMVTINNSSNKDLILNMQLTNKEIKQNVFPAFHFYHRRILNFAHVFYPFIRNTKPTLAHQTIIFELLQFLSTKLFSRSKSQSLHTKLMKIKATAHIK